MQCNDLLDFVVSKHFNRNGDNGDKCFIDILLYETEKKRGENLLIKWWNFFFIFYHILFDARNSRKKSFEFPVCVHFIQFDASRWFWANLSVTKRAFLPIISAKVIVWGLLLTIGLYFGTKTGHFYPLCNFLSNIKIKVKIEMYQTLCTQNPNSAQVWDNNG